MIRIPTLAFVLAGLVACGQTTEFELSALDPASPEALAKAEEAAWTALESTPGMLEGVQEVEVERLHADETGVAHVRYQQLLHGVPVFGGEVIVHVDPDGAVTGFTDALAREARVSPGVEYSREEAEEIALAHDHRGVQPTEAPQSELVVVEHQGAWHMAWKVRTPFLGDNQPAIPMRFIDAKTGALLFEFDDLKTYSLSDSDKVTYDLNNGTRFSSAAVGDSSDGDLLTTHTAMGQALSFLSSNLGRDSFDGNGAVVRSYGHYSRNYVNAYWDGTRLVFGDGDGTYSNYLGVLDVAGHELAHAITDYEANLTYSYESGALNEGASDIFAAALEAWVDGGTSQSVWDVGEDCWLQGRALRYMQYPSADGSSRDHYSARYTGTQDNGGVHWNSGIANHWFYLLAEGGQHHNSSYRSGYTVQGIGTDAAYRIFYVALSSYMTSSTNFSGARTATESACAALGYGADTCHSVKLAWYEVGVGSDPGNYSGGGGGGTDTGTTDTGTTDTGSVTCPNGYGTVTGTLSGSGDTDSYTYSASSGTHYFLMEGASGTDFDIKLYQSVRNRWRQRASSESASSSESIAYSGSSGDYRIDVLSYSGSGDYTLCYVLP